MPRPGQSAAVLGIATAIAALLFVGVAFVALGFTDRSSSTPIAASSFQTTEPTPSISSSPFAWTPPPDPTVPAGLTLYRDPSGRFAVGVPDGWIVVDLSNASGVDAAIASAKWTNPTRAQDLDTMRSKLQGNEALLAIGPPTGAIIKFMAVTTTGPVRGVMSPTFASSFRQQLQSRLEIEGNVLSDLEVSSRTINAQPAMTANVLFTATLSSGAKDDVHRRIAMVEGDKNDYILTMSTDTPDADLPQFDQAIETLTPLK